GSSPDAARPVAHNHAQNRGLALDARECWSQEIGWQWACQGTRPNHLNAKGFRSLIPLMDLMTRSKVIGGPPGQFELPRPWREGTLGGEQSSVGSRQSSRRMTACPTLLVTFGGSAR